MFELPPRNCIELSHIEAMKTIPFFRLYIKRMERNREKQDKKPKTYKQMRSRNIYLHRDLMVDHLMLFLFANHPPIAMPSMAVLLCPCYGRPCHLDWKNCICQLEAIFQKIPPKVATAKINQHPYIIRLT
jgi:hypothetical protein